MLHQRQQQSTRNMPSSDDTIAYPQNSGLRMSEKPTLDSAVELSDRHQKNPGMEREWTVMGYNLY